MSSISPPGRLARLRRRIATIIIDPFSAAWSAQFGGGRQAPSADGTTLLAGQGGAIVDVGGNVWQISQGRQVTLNGKVDQSTISILLLAYVDEQVWQQNNVGLWWHRTAGTGWQPPHGSLISPFLKTRPGQVLSLQATTVTTTTITLHWQAPSTGATPVTYSVQMRAGAATNWSEVSKTTQTAAVIVGLAPGVTYNIEVLAINC